MLEATEQEIPRGSILVVHQERKTQRTLQRILGATGYRIDVADELVQGVRLIQHHAPRLVAIATADGQVQPGELNHLLREIDKVHQLSSEHITHSGNDQGREADPSDGVTCARR